MMLFKKNELGRTMVEMVGVFAVIILLGILAIVAFTNTVCSNEADRVYEDIVLTVSSVRNRGTARTSNGIADTSLITARSRTGKKFSVERDCPGGAFTIKVEDIDQKTCSYLMDKGWQKVVEPICFYRANHFEDVCRGNVLDSASDGYYMLVGVDCSKMNAPEKGVFAVTFALDNETEKIRYCKTDSSCGDCQRCDTVKQVCVSIAGCDTE